MGNNTGRDGKYYILVHFAARLPFVLVLLFLFSRWWYTMYLLQMRVSAAMNSSCLVKMILILFLSCLTLKFHLFT